MTLNYIKQKTVIDFKWIKIIRKNYKITITDHKNMIACPKYLIGNQALEKKFIHLKMDLKFPNPKFNILCAIAYILI